MSVGLPEIRTLAHRRFASVLTVLVMLSVLLGGCAGRDLPPPSYESVDELSKCAPDECVLTSLKFQHWANAPHYKGRLPYHCTPGAELDGPPDPGITRLIFVIHGSLGSKREQFARIHTPPGLLQLRNVQNALRRARQADPSIDPDTIAIVAPNFQRTSQWQPYTDEDRRLWTWRGTSWDIGAMSAENRTRGGALKAEPVSGFDVFDEFLRAALIKFPNLEQLVIVGHSGGGQGVHRYAMLGVGVHEHIEAEGIRIRYIPANPGGYAFPLMVRKLPPGRSTVPPGPGRGDTDNWRWAVPKCEGYDDWGFGLGGLDRLSSDRTVRAANYAIENYLRTVDRKLARQAMREVGTRTWDKAARIALRMQYATREIWHIQAAIDTDSTFPESCPAQAQGRSRFERFSNFRQAWDELVSDVNAPNLHFVALENANHPHSSRVVYASEIGMELLFH